MTVFGLPPDTPWKKTFAGSVEDRPIEVEVLPNDDAVRVKTVQKKTVADPRTILVISAGDAITIDGENPDDLERRLVAEGDFTSDAAKEIANHAR